MSELNKIPEVGFRNLKKKDFEFEIQSNKIFFKNSKDNEPPFRPHRISFFGILFTMEGEGEHIIDFKKYPYKKGTVIFLSKEQVHAFVRNENREAYLLTFTEKFLEKSSFGSNLMQMLSLFNYHLYSPIIQLNEKQYNMMLELVLSIKEEYEGKDDVFTEEIIQSALKILLFNSERILKANINQDAKGKYYDEFALFQGILSFNV